MAAPGHDTPLWSAAHEGSQEGTRAFIMRKRRAAKAAAKAEAAGELRRMLGLQPTSKVAVAPHCEIRLAEGLDDVEVNFTPRRMARGRRRGAARRSCLGRKRASCDERDDDSEVSDSDGEQVELPAVGDRLQVYWTEERRCGSSAQ